VNQEPTKPEVEKPELRTTAWVSSIYFAEGYPYAIVNTVAETMFTELKASLQVIGLTSLFHLPWNLKFLWAPWVDLYETKRGWTLWVEVAITALLLILTAVSLGSSPLLAAAAVFMALAVLSATHDIAIDGFYLEALDEAEQSRYVGVRVAAYRVALTVAAGLLVSVGGRFGWPAAWFCAAVLMAALVVAHAVSLPKVEERRTPVYRLLRGVLRRRVLVSLAVAGLLVAAEVYSPVLRPWGAALQARTSISSAGFIGVGLLVVLLAGLAATPWLRGRLARGNGAYAAGFVDFLGQRRIGHVLAFVVLFRLGESLLLKMRYPFLSQDVGMDVEYFGLAVVGAGGVASIIATLAGGRLIARDGLRRWLWPFVLAQNVLNLLYMAVAMAPEPAKLGLPLVTALIGLEHIGAGLGTSVFMVYLMRCCDPRHRATHMAILTALMSIGFTIAGVASGFIAARLGFGLYFAFTFVATIPSMLLIPGLPHLDGREADCPPGTSG